MVCGAEKPRKHAPLPTVHMPYVTKGGYFLGEFVGKRLSEKLWRDPRKSWKMIPSDSEERRCAKLANETYSKITWNMLY